MLFCDSIVCIGGHWRSTWRMSAAIQGLQEGRARRGFRFRQARDKFQILETDSRRRFRLHVHISLDTIFKLCCVSRSSIVKLNTTLIRRIIGASNRSGSTFRRLVLDRSEDTSRQAEAPYSPSQGQHAQHIQSVKAIRNTLSNERLIDREWRLFVSRSRDRAKEHAFRRDSAGIN